MTLMERVSFFACTAFCLSFVQPLVQCRHVGPTQQIDRLAKHPHARSPGSYLANTNSSGSSRGTKPWSSRPATLHPYITSPAAFFTSFFLFAGMRVGSYMDDPNSGAAAVFAALNLSSFSSEEMVCCGPTSQPPYTPSDKGIATRAR
jgi:hypothetical protein